jgi:hypothetical protein
MLTKFVSNRPEIITTNDPLPPEPNELKVHAEEEDEKKNIARRQKSTQEQIELEIFNQAPMVCDPNQISPKDLLPTSLRIASPVPSISDNYEDFQAKQVSISPTFCVRLFHMKVLREAFT